MARGSAQRIPHFKLDHIMTYINVLILLFGGVEQVTLMQCEVLKDYMDP